MIICSIDILKKKKKEKKRDYVKYRLKGFYFTLQSNNCCYRFIISIFCLPLKNEDNYFNE